MNVYWRGQKVSVRAVEPTDGALFHAGILDADIQRCVSELRVPMSRKACDEFVLSESIKGNNSLVPQTFVLEDLAGCPVGMLDTGEIDLRNRSFTLGIWILPEHRRRGYAREATELCFRFFFEELGFEKYNARVYAFNEGSIAACEALGCVLEGTIRRAIYTGGMFYDQQWYGLTREEYFAGIGARLG